MPRSDGHIAPEPDDTISAVSSPAGASPRAIVRLSGPRALIAVASLFRPDSGGDLMDAPTYTSMPGEIALSGAELRVPAAVYVMRAPWSYTREDVVEIHTVGAPPLIEMMFEELLSRQVRLAGPGEFTRRAYLRGRIDLAQAESVMAVIRSGSEAELRGAVAGLQGRWSTQAAKAREHLTDLCSHVELLIDFSDQGIEPFSIEDLREDLARGAAEVQSLLERVDAGAIPADAVAAVIYGRPNVGKSSLMNALGVSRRSIVTPQPGTTRDTVENVLEIGGVWFRFIDTAGLRETDNALEQMAAARAKEAARRADLGVLVVDGTAPLCAGDIEIATSLCPPTVIAVVNKCDLPQNLGLGEVSRLPNVREVIVTSALTGAGIAELKDAMVGAVLGGRVDRTASVRCINARHRDALQRAGAALGRAGALLAPGMAAELVAFELREALSALGEIGGEVTSEDLLDRIFSQFCIGK